MRKTVPPAMYPRFRKALAIIVLLAVSFACWQCSPSKETNAGNPAFAAYVEGYTSGILSKEGNIVIRLAAQVSSLQEIGATDTRNLFSLSPSVKGTTYWTDARTVIFDPEEPLKPGQEYHVRFALGELVEVPKKLNEFSFGFKVTEPAFDLSFDGLKSQTNSATDYMRFVGHIALADREDTDQVEKILRADLAGQSLPITWQHNPDARTATFSIDSIARGEQAAALRLSWDGNPIASKAKDSKTWDIPALGDFRVMDVRAVHEPEQHVVVQFSDPILVAQDLNGLINVSEIEDLQYTIEGSEVKLYTSERLEGDYAVSINAGVENINAKKLGINAAANIIFENRLPSVSIPGQGTILPGSGKLTLPFEAVNLRAVDVVIIKIYENNIPQYFQTDYDSSWELRRVGKPVVQTTISLDEDKGLNLRRKNRFSLDVDRLLKTEPGAIYRVRIGFRQEYSIYACPDAVTQAEEDDDYGHDYYGDYGDRSLDEDDEFWSRYNNHYPHSYRWDQRDNPCHASYYTADRWATRDLLASNIGLIVKGGNDNSMSVVATDILTAEPISGVALKVLDYQQQIIETATTGNDGMAQFEVSRKPFMLVATRGDERGYLKLDDGSSLPLSRFDVGGQVVQKGIKGFIYGERGVWRPGDSVFVSFIMENQSAHLPDNHPVTFELFNPNGQLSRRLVESKHVNGFYTFKTATERTAPTGNWLARIRVGGATFERVIKVETVMPNRLKIDLDFGGKKVLVANGDAEVDVSAHWLFGTPAQNFKTVITANAARMATSFADYRGYSFDDPTRGYYPEELIVFDGTLDDHGQARFSLDGIAPNQAPGMLRVNMTTRVFEPGGNFSIDQYAIPFSPYDAYVGLRVPEGNRLSGMLPTDQDHTVSLAAVDPEGKKLSGMRRVQVEFYKIRWQWWWNQEGDFLGNFTQDKYNQLLKKETLTLNNGEGKWDIRVNYPDWGRYLIRVVDLESGHAAGKTLYVDWPNWASREQQSNPTEASMLSFTADKDTYAVGENVTLTFPSSEGGRGLISIENGSRVVRTFWIDTQQGQTVYKFKVDEEMAPNVFVNVTLLQPHAQTANDLPIRMYGVIPLIVENPKTILDPTIQMAASLKPETKNRITVAEASGKAMTYTVAIVDEGLLDLTRFQTPDPHASFYAKEALGVKSWDLFDKVIGAWGGDLERILSIGGDADVNRNVDPAKANRFQPVVKFLGPFTLRRGGKNTHEFDLPQYVGSVRAMVIAGQDGAYGFAEQAVPVKKPLMLLATLPRVIGPKETFKLPLTVFAMEDNIKQVSLEVTASGGLTVEKGKQQVNFTRQGEKIVYATIRAGDNTGVGRVKAIARSGNETATYEVEIDIRNPNPYITSVHSVEVAGNAQGQYEIEPLGPGNNNQATVEISSLPPISLDKHLGYLIRYPHGCLEQITSGVFPQLMLDRLMQLTDKQKLDVETNIKSAIDRIRNYQITDGGFGYWPGAREAEEWSTNYVGHFLIEAQAKGYVLPPGMLDNWRRYQRGKAHSWAPNQYNWRGGDLVQAYRLYLLALAKSPDLGAMNRLKEFQYLSDEAAWHLAAAYQLAGQRIVANQLIKGKSIDGRGYTTAGRTFGSQLRDRAMILETLTIMGRTDEANRLLLAVASALGNQNWYSTQTTAYALLAIAKAAGDVTGDMSFTYTLNGKTQEVESKHYLHQVELDDPNSKNIINIQNKDSRALFVRIIRDGQAAPGENPPQENRPDMLTMAVRYTTLQGQEINPAELVQGTDLIAEVTLKNTGSIGTHEHVALTQIFPSGWEIINTRLNDQATGIRSAPATYQDIRDDRVLTYFNIRENETLTYRVLLNASYTGRFYLPSVSAEAMYDNRVQAIFSGQWVEVVELPR